MKTNTINRLGFYSSILTTILNVCYFITFVLYIPILNAPWTGLSTYIASFKSLPFLAWVVPCLLLPSAFLIMISCVHALTREDKKIWSLLALVFSAIYTGILSTQYFIQATLINHNMMAGSMEGLLWWIYSYNIPYNFPLVLEGVGYSFMAAAAVFMSLVFEKGKIQKWIRWSFIGFAVTGLILPFSLIITLPIFLVPISLGLNGLFLTLGPVLLAVLFKNPLTNKV